MMIFLDEADRTKYLNILHTTIERFNWLCHVYCLMGNHYHLMIETPVANLAKGMKYLNQVYRGKDHRRWRHPLGSELRFSGFNIYILRI